MASFFNKRNSISQERILGTVSSKNDDYSDAIPLEVIVRNTGGWGEKENGNEGMETSNVKDDQVEGPPSASSSPPPPPQPFLDDERLDGGTRGNRLFSANRMQKGIDWCSKCFLFYITTMQPSLKCGFCVAIMCFDILLDNSCHNVKCQKPVYTYDRAIYFMVCLAIATVSAVQFCIGAYLFAKFSTLTRQALIYPMKCYAVAISIQLFIVGVSAFIVDINMTVLIVTIVMIAIEIVAVLTTLCFPNPYYMPLESPTGGAGQDEENPDDESLYDQE